MQLGVSKYLVTVVIVALTTLFQWSVYPLVDPAPYLLYYPMLILAARYGDGNLAVILSAVVVQYLFVSPQHSLPMAWPRDYWRTGLFLVSGFMVVLVTRQLSRARDNEARARKNAEKAAEDLGVERDLRETFVATLSHDLRGPLTAAKTSAQLLHRYPEKIEQRERLTLRVIDSIDRADEMIEDLLDANRIRAGQPLPLQVEHCDLKAVTENAIEELTLIYGNRFVIETDDKVSGYWSCNGVRRVIENLANNAIKYGCPKSPVTVSLRNAQEGVEVSVHNAVGDHPISAAEIETLWSPYLRQKSVEKSGKAGWGLGLTLVRGITEAHGGRVAVRTSPTEGTTFVVQLPRDARNAGT